MIKNLRKDKKGFTLIEIIVVLVIMGILLAIAVPSVLGYISKAQDQQYIAEARNGFLGANTIVATENAKAVAKADRSKLQKAEVNKEIGETDLISGMDCSLAKDGTDTKYKITSCKIKLKSNTKERYYTFTANKDVVGTDIDTTNTFADKAATYE